jgi:hypothetical protein
LTRRIAPTDISGTQAVSHTLRPCKQHRPAVDDAEHVSFRARIDTAPASDADERVNLRMHPHRFVKTGELQSLQSAVSRTFAPRILQ